MRRPSSARSCPARRTRSTATSTRRDRLPGWEHAGFLESRGFLLTPQELDALCERLDALLGELRPADATDAPEGALPVRVLAFGYPFLPPEETP